MKKPKLTIEHKDKKSFIASCITKRCPKSPPSTFSGEVFYFPKTEDDTQTFSVKINMIVHKGGKAVLSQSVEDEFDTKRMALKWIKTEFKDFVKAL